MYSAGTSSKTATSKGPCGSRQPPDAKEFFSHVSGKPRASMISQGISFTGISSSRFMKIKKRPSINFLLALLSFLSLTLLPAVASPNSCCVSTAVSEESCMCSQSSSCCQDSTPSSMAVDQATVTVKPVKNVQVPYNATVWTPVVQMVRLAPAQPIFKKPAAQVYSTNKRYLQLRVLLI